MRFWPVAFVFLLAACEPSKFEQPLAPSGGDPQVQAEQAAEEEMAYDAHMKLTDAIWRVGDRMLAANVALCRTKHRNGYSPEFHIATLAKTQNLYRKAALARYPQLGKGATVVYVDPGSSPAHSGIEAGDLVVSVGASNVPNNEDAAQTLARVFDASLGRSVQVRLERKGQTMTVAVNPVPACNYLIGLVGGRQINSYTDDRGIHVYDGMVQFVKSDDELATIIGHELAHNLCGHIDGDIGTRLALTFGSVDSVVPVEEQADYVGLYLMARAGYDVDKALELWRRMAATAMPQDIDHDSDHPSFAVRVVMLKREISEIRSKEARGIPLLPDEQVATQATKSSASPLAKQ